MRSPWLAASAQSITGCRSSSHASPAGRLVHPRPPARHRRPETRAFRPWDGLLKNIRDSVCTPILGFGLLESLVATRADIAWHWAERYHYPLAELDRQDLARIAQFVAVDQANVTVPGDQLKRYLKRELLDQLDDATRTSLPNRDLETLLEAALLGPLRKDLGKLPDEPGQRTRALLDAAADGLDSCAVPRPGRSAVPDLLRPPRIHCLRRSSPP